jgi:DNA mismatch repair protein MutS
MPPPTPFPPTHPTCRGTSTFDGCALAYAVLERLTGAGAGDSASTAPRVLFATHYHNIISMPELRGFVQLGHMASELEAAPDEPPPAGGGGGGGRRLALRNTFELRPGSAPSGSCGIDVAAAAGLPERVVRRAREAAAAMERRHEGAHGGACGPTAPRQPSEPAAGPQSAQAAALLQRAGRPGDHAGRPPGGVQAPGAWVAECEDAFDEEEW